MTTSTQYNPNDIPQRGEAVYINFDPQKGFEIEGRRPALVLSPKNFNRSKNSVVVCPITNTKRSSEFRVEIPNGLDVGGYILTDQIKTLNWRPRRSEHLCYLSNNIVEEVSGIVEAIIHADEHDPDYIPWRGEAVEIEGEFRERVNALILSASGFNYLQRMFVICPIIDSANESAFSKFAVEIPDEESVNVKGFILADQVKSWDWWARGAKHLCYLPNDTVDQVSDIVKAIVWGD